MNRLIVCAALAGCASNDTNTTIAVDANDLGITTLVVSQSTDMLTFRGVDRGGAEVAVATLTHGRVLYRTETALEGTWIDHGTELQLSITDGGSWSDVSPTKLPSSLPEPRDTQLQTFVRIHAVSDALAREGITFRQKLPAAPELGYSYADCDGSTDEFPIGKPVLSCCVEFSGTSAWYAYHLASSTQYVTRDMGPPCTQYDRTTPCSGGPAQCYHGPCGAHIYSVTNYPNPVLYSPNNGVDRCGFDSDRNSQSGNAFPYQWSPGLGAEFGGIDASCNCTQCVNGQPQDPNGNSCTHYQGT